MNSTGEITTAVSPIKGMLPTLYDSGTPQIITEGGTGIVAPAYWGGISSRSTLNNYLQSLGLPSQVVTTDLNTVQLDITKLVNYPVHATATHSELAARGLHVRSYPFEASARDFRSFEFQSVGTDCLDVYTSTSADGHGQSLGMDLGSLTCSGLETVLLGGRGFAAGDAVSLEVIYHVEGIPNPSYSLVARPTSAIVPAPPNNTLDSQLTRIHVQPRVSFMDMVTAAGDAIMGEIEGRVRAAGAQGLGSLVGTLSRLLIAGQ